MTDAYSRETVALYDIILRYGTLVSPCRRLNHNV
jgi:hypothetical protein